MLVFVIYGVILYGMCSVLVCVACGCMVLYGLLFVCVVCVFVLVYVGVLCVYV